MSEPFKPNVSIAPNNRTASVVPEAVHGKVKTISAVGIIPNIPSDANVLSACPLVLANDPNYLANDPRACAGSGISATGQARPGVKVISPSVR